jgi:integrase
MPLIVTRRPDRSGWWISGTVTPAGCNKGVRIRRRAGAADLRTAREEAAAIEAKILRDHHHGERAAPRTWAEAVTSYVKFEPRAAGTLALLRRLTQHFGDLPLDQLNQVAVDRARELVLRPGAAPATVLRNLVVPIRAVMHHAALRGWGPEPRIEAPRQPPGRTPILLPAQYEAFAAVMPARHHPLLAFLICTGCRRGEAWALDWADVDLTAATARLWADQTKARKGRVVHMPPAAVAALAGLPGRRGPVFDGADPKKAIATASGRSGVAVRGLHDLRHAWASYHYAMHRDLLALREAGGWASVGQVERYAHLLPAGQQPAIARVWGLSPGCPQARAAK